MSQEVSHLIPNCDPEFNLIIFHSPIPLQRQMLVYGSVNEGFTSVLVKSDDLGL